MKKLCFLLLCGVLLLAACAERPDASVETDAVETEAPYVEPPKTYLQALAEIPGYQDYPDSIHCYTDPLISDLSELSAVTFDESLTDSRFISCNDFYDLEFQWSNGEATVSQPNANYLTEADGTRTKLCPVDWCRSDDRERCSHVNLTGGIVIGDWVYFIGKNHCEGAPNHPNRSAELPGGVNMLLRYSVKDQRIEKVMNLTGTSSIDFSAGGVLYISMYNPTVKGWQTLLVDAEDLTAAVHAYVKGLHGAVYHDGWLYFGSLRRATPDLETVETVTDYGMSASLLGVRGNTFYFLVNCDASDDMAQAKKHQLYTDESDRRSYVLTWHPGRGFIKVLDHLSDAVLAGNSLYVVPRDSRTVFTVTDNRTTGEWFDFWAKRDPEFPDADTFFVNTTGEVLRYALNMDGTLDTDSAEVICTEPAGEFLTGISAYGDSIRLHTIVDATETETAYRDGAYIYYFSRNYIYDGQLKLDGESTEYRHGGGWYEE